MTMTAACPLTPDAQKAYDAYATRYHGDLSDTANFAQTLFNAGFRQAVLAMREFGDLMPQLSRIESSVNRIHHILEAIE